MTTKAAQPKRKRTHLEHQVRVSLRKRIDEFDWDWETAGRYERHAINAVLDLEEAEKLNKELLAALKELLRAVTPELTGPPKNIPKSAWATQWDKAEAAIKKAEEGS